MKTGQAAEHGYTDAEAERIIKRACFDSAILDGDELVFMNEITDDAGFFTVSAPRPPCTCDIPGLVQCDYHGARE